MSIVQSMIASYISTIGAMLPNYESITHMLIGFLPLCLMCAVFPFIALIRTANKMNDDWSTEIDKKRNGG